jgi:acyl-CoA thioesterase I
MSVITVSRYYSTIALSILVLIYGFADTRAQDTLENESRGVIVVLGDSLAAGYGVDPQEAFPALLQKKINEKKLPFNIVNAGVSGDTTSSGLRRLSWVLQKKVDVLILELGGNDGLRGLPLEVTESNLRSIITQARAKYPQCQIVLAGMRMPPNLGEEYTRDFENLFIKIAKSEKTHFIPFLLEGVGGIPRLNLPDRVHPTVEGQKIVADNVWRVLEKVLKRRA